jgi:FkbM family methyltransferase
MSLEQLARVCDLMLLQTASRYDLSRREERDASNTWLVDLFGRMLVQAVRPELVLEIGAFSAEFSRRIRSKLPDAEFHAFEANPYNHAKFHARAEDAGVQYHHLAVGETVGACTFKVARKLDGQDVPPTKGNNSLRTKPLDIEYEQTSVQMVTVDHFVRDRGLAGKGAAMWIDLEGCAYEALQGAQRTLEHTGAIFIEVEDEALWSEQKLSGDVRGLLARAGFLPVARDFETKRQYNMIYLKGGLLDEIGIRQIMANSVSQAGFRTHAGVGVGPA